MKKDIKNLKNEYGIDLFNDFILDNSDTFYFYIDLTLGDILTSPIQKINNYFPHNIQLDKHNIESIFLNINTVAEEVELQGYNRYVQKQKDLITSVIEKKKVKINLPLIYINDIFFLEINLKYFEDKNLVIGLMRDNTEDRLIVEQLLRSSNKDFLTGLFNRNTCTYHLKSISQENESSYIFMADLNSFKLVNDVYGHHKGDEVLKEFAERLMKIPNDQIIFYRLAGDEFIAQVKNMTFEEIIELANKINECAVYTSFEDMKVSASVGIIKYQEGMTDVEILRYVDFAMYEAKRQRKHCYAYLSYEELKNIESRLK